MKLHPGKFRAFKKKIDKKKLQKKENKDSLQETGKRQNQPKVFMPE